jgi:hypothetical protein
MKAGLRGDEKFVMDAVAEKLSGTWRSGENPPDAYLKVNDLEIAVEISILMDFRPGGPNGRISRMSDDMPAAQLVNELDEELKDEIPGGFAVSLSLWTPFRHKRAVKGPLKAKIRELLLHPMEQHIRETFSGNKIEISITKGEEGVAGVKKVNGVIGPSALPLRDLLTTAWCILEERINAKAESVRSRKINAPLWLALYNGYPPANEETYRRAMGFSSGR